MTLIRNFAENIQSDGDLIITGDLQVDGTTTTVNSTVVDIADKNITLGVGAATNAQNDGAGISILLPDASPDEFATILYTNSSDSWSFNKDVGIGTATPAGNLHIKSTGDVGDATLIIEADNDNNIEQDNPRLEFRQDGNFVSGSLYLEGLSGETATNTLDNALVLDSKGALNNQAIQFATGGRAAAQSGGESNSTVAMTILGSNRNVGIGTTSPDSKLDVEADEDTWLARIYNTGSDANAQGLLVRSDATAAHDAPVMGVYADGAYKMLVKSTGKVGIGNSSPASTLDLTNGTDTAERAIRIQNDTVTLYTGVEGSSGNRFVGSAVGNAFFGTTSAHGLELATNNNVRMVIDSAGNVGIGNTSPTSNLTIGSAQSDGLEFTFDSSNTYRNRIVNYWNSSTDTRMDFEIGPTGNVAPTTVMSVGYGGGNVGIGTTSPSDRLVVQKDSANIEPILVLKNDNTTDDNGASIDFSGKDTSGNNILYGRITAKYTNHATEKSHMIFTHRNDSGTFSEWMRVTHDAYVGIGTEFPSVTLHVDGPAESLPATSGTTQTGIFRLGSTDSGDTGVLDFGTAPGAKAWLQATDRTNVGLGYTLLLNPNGGNVGIGTDSPDYALDVYDVGEAWIRADSSTTTESTANSGLRFAHGGVNHGVLYHRGSDDALLYFDNIAASTRFLIDSSGNVGIGIDSPTSKFHVDSAPNGNNPTTYILQNGATNAPTLRIAQTGDGGNPNVTQGLLIEVAGTNDGSSNLIRAVGKNSNVNGGVDVEAFVVQNGGNVGIGTSTPGAKLEISGKDDAGASDLLRLQFDNSPADTGITFTDIDSDIKNRISMDSGNTNDLRISSGTKIHLYGGTTNGTTSPHLTVSNNGNVGIGKDTPATALDVTGTITQNTVSRQAIAFSIPANVARKVKLTIANYDAFKVTLSAQRSNAGNSIVWWEGYINNNDNVGYANVISSQTVGGNISYTFTNNNNGIFEWDFNSSASIGGGTVIIESAGLNLNANLATYSNV